MSFDLLDHPVALSLPQRNIPSSWTRYIPLGMLLVDLIRPRLLVELGTDAGVSYCAFCQAVTELRLDTRCYGIEAAGERAAQVDLAAYHAAKYAAFSTLLPANTYNDPSRFADSSIDLLHISGQAGQFSDDVAASAHEIFQTWLPKMSDSGVILLTGAPTGDVSQAEATVAASLWRLLTQRYPSHLVTQPYGQDESGIGFVVVGTVAPAGVRSLLQLSPVQWRTLSETLVSLGERNALALRLTETSAQLERERAQARSTRTTQLRALQAMKESSAQQQSDLQQRLDNALWQLAWLDASRGVRMVKLARAARRLWAQRGPFWLAQRALLWSLGKRGYYRQDSAAALPTPKSARIATGERKQVMFISGCPGGAMRYRCDHQVEQLRLMGVTAEAEALSRVNLLDVLDRFECFMLHRVPYDSDVHVFVTEARKRGKPVIFETDDLVFIPDNARHQAELERFSAQDRTLYIDEMGRIRKTLTLSDAATVSTQALYEWVKPITSDVVITPNVVSKEMLMRSAVALAQRESPATPGAGLSGSEQKITIAYFSGSPSHDRDFREAQDAVLWALDTYPHVEFLLVGPLKLNSQFDRFGSRVQHWPVRPWQELPDVYAQVNINLAPLERNNPFTEAKSSIKYLEAALLKVPTVASARQDFVRVMRHGVNGLLADSPEEWRDALRQVIESPTLRRTLGETAFEEVCAQHTTPAHAPTYTDEIRAIYRRLVPPGANRTLTINWVMDAQDMRGNGERPSLLAVLARLLAERGHVVRLCILDEQSAAPSALPGEWASLDYRVVGRASLLPDADVSVATSTATAFLVAEQHESRFKVYLIQDDAPISRASMRPSVADEVERSYDLPLRQIGVGAHAYSWASERSGVEAAEIDCPTDISQYPQTAQQVERLLLDACW